MRALRLPTLLALACCRRNGCGPRSRSWVCDAKPTDDQSQLQEVVVTAQFRREDIQATPLAIGAIDSELQS